MVMAACTSTVPQQAPEAAQSQVHRQITNKKQARIGAGTVSALLSYLRRSRVYPRYLAGCLWNSAFKKRFSKFENLKMSLCNGKIVGNSNSKFQIL